MGEDQEERYDIAFAGECLAGHDASAVREALGVLFKADDATLDRLFSGKRQSIKRLCDKATALKYQKSLAKAGAKAIVTRASSVTPQSPTAAPSSTSPEADTSNAGDSFALLPGGSDILRPDERTQQQDTEVDLSHLSLAEAGDRLSAETDADNIGTPILAPDFDVAEAGARMAAPSEDRSIAAPDTSALDLAPVGEDLGEQSDASPAPTVSTDHLDLADTGSDLLKAEERKVSDAAAPDTSHLELDAPANPFET